MTTVPFRPPIRPLRPALLAAALAVGLLASGSGGGPAAAAAPERGAEHATVKRAAAPRARATGPRARAALPRRTTRAKRSGRARAHAASRALRTTGRAHVPLPLRTGLPPTRPALQGAPIAPTPVPTSPATGTADPAAAPVPVGSAPTVEPVPLVTLPALGVRVSETPVYRATLSRATVPAGPVRVQLQNEGEDPHDLRIERLDGGLVAGLLDLTLPGATRTRTITFTPGTYVLACTLQAPVDHADAGMRAELTVTG